MLARQRLLRQLRTAQVANPVVITGDWHSTFVNDVLHDFDRPGSRVVATEFVTPAITSNGDGPVYGPCYGHVHPLQPAHPLLRGRPEGLFSGST